MLGWGGATRIYLAAGATVGRVAKVGGSAALPQEYRDLASVQLVLKPLY